MIGDLLYQIGYALGGLEAEARGGERAETGIPEEGAAVYDPETGEAIDLEEAPHGSSARTAGAAALGTFGALMLARMLVPRPIRWPRAIVAGVAATALADFVGRYFEDEPGPGRLPYAEDPQELVARFGAGVAVASGYAAILYPRLPGSPLLRGLMFGGLEIAAAPRGGLVRLAMETPGVRFPLQALALPMDEDAGPMSHLAFGLGLGLFYRDPSLKEEEELEDDELHEDGDFDEDE